VDFTFVVSRLTNAE